MQRIKSALRRLFGLVDLRDLHCYGGLAGMGYGLAQVSEPLAWCAVGAVLFLLSLRRVNGPS